MKTAAKVFIWIGMVIQFFLIFPIVVGALALNKLSTATKKEELQTMGILTIFLCSPLAGIFMLCIKDEELRGDLPPSSDTRDVDLYAKHTTDDIGQNSSYRKSVEDVYNFTETVKVSQDNIMFGDYLWLSNLIEKDEINLLKVSKEIPILEHKKIEEKLKVAKTRFEVGVTNKKDYANERKYILSEYLPSYMK